MPYRRFLRLNRSSATLLAVTLTAALAVVAFGDLAISRRNALEEQRAAQQKLDLLQDQNRRLVYALEQAERGQSVQPKAWQYYRRAPRGAIVVEEAPAKTDASVGGNVWEGMPIWMSWVEKLLQGLTSLRK